MHESDLNDLHDATLLRGTWIGAMPPAISGSLPGAAGLPSGPKACWASLAREKPLGDLAFRSILLPLVAHWMARSANCESKCKAEVS